MSKAILGAALAFALVADSAQAADLPVKAALFSPEPVSSWTSFYVGGHVGAGWGYLGGFSFDATANETSQSVGRHFTLNSNEIDTFFDPQASQIRQQQYYVTISDDHPSGSVTESVGLNVASAVADTFVFHRADGQQVYFNFDANSASADIIELDDVGVSSFNELMLQSINNGQDTLVDLGQGDSLTRCMPKTCTPAISIFTAGPDFDSLRRRASPADKS